MLPGVLALVMAAMPGVAVTGAADGPASAALLTAGAAFLLTPVPLIARGTG